MRLLGLLSLLLLSACGQAGDLYLPEEKPAPQQESAAPPAPAPAADDTKKKE